MLPAVMLRPPDIQRLSFQLVHVALAFAGAVIVYFPGDEDEHLARPLLNLVSAESALWHLLPPASSPASPFSSAAFPAAASPAAPSSTAPDPLGFDFRF